LSDSDSSPLLDVDDEATFTLDPVLMIDRVDVLKAFADPLRLRILRALYVKQRGRALSGRQLQDLLGERGNRRIYHHLKVLQEAGIIELAYEKKKRNMMEAFFRPVAANLHISPTLLTPPPDEEGPPGLLYDMAVAMVGALQSDLRVFTDAQPDDVVLRHREVMLRDDDAKRMRQELVEVLDRYEAQSSTSDDDAVDGVRSHRITVVAYPSDDVA